MNCVGERCEPSREVVGTGAVVVVVAGGSSVAGREGVGGRPEEGILIGA